MLHLQHLLYCNKGLLDGVTAAATAVATTTTAAAVTAATATASRTLWTVDPGLVDELSTGIVDTEGGIGSLKNLLNIRLARTGEEHYDKIVDEQRKNNGKQCTADVLHRFGNPSSLHKGLNLL